MDAYGITRNELIQALRAVGDNARAIDRYLDRSSAH